MQAIKAIYTSDRLNGRRHPRIPVQESEAVRSFLRNMFLFLKIWKFHGLGVAQVHVHNTR